MITKPGHGSKKGGKQSTHLTPSCDGKRCGGDPDCKGCEKTRKFHAGREAYQQMLRDTKERRKKYTEQLSEMKSEQLQAVSEHIANDTIASPAEMLVSMIKEQQLIVSNDKLNARELSKERELLLKMYDRYAALTGANAPSSQSVDITTEVAEEKSPEAIQKELLDTVAKLKVVK